MTIRRMGMMHLPDESRDPGLPLVHHPHPPDRHHRPLTLDILAPSLCRIHPLSRVGSWPGLLPDPDRRCPVPRVGHPPDALLPLPPQEEGKMVEAQREYILTLDIFSLWTCSARPRSGDRETDLRRNSGWRRSG